MAVEKVLLAEPRGFCAGVQMAIKALSWMVRVFAPPVYCNHEIVHNQSVVSQFRERGVIFVDDIADVPDGAPVMLSAHGSAPSVVLHAKEHAGTCVNAVCPLVTKVHHELKVRAQKGYTVIYIGHAGHQEAVGTMAVAPDSVYLVESVEDVLALPEIDTPVALLTQTTLSIDECANVQRAVRDRFPDVWLPNRSDLCYATTNRQTALRNIASTADAVVVVGSANSSNTLALTHVARALCGGRVVRVNGAQEVPADLTGKVAVTAGASAPDEAVQAVIRALSPTHGVEVVVAIDEEEYFPPPRELRELLELISTLTSVSLGAPISSQSLLDTDRDVYAGHVLKT